LGGSQFENSPSKKVSETTISTNKPGRIVVIPSKHSKSQPETSPRQKSMRLYLKNTKKKGLEAWIMW
jgi:hypothetical protein